MKYLVVAAALAAVWACGGDDGSGSHDLVTCGSDWGSSYSSCEQACADKNNAAPAGLGPCDATDSRLGSQYHCIDTETTPDGRGCCVQGPDAVLFFGCN